MSDAWQAPGSDTPPRTVSALRIPGMLLVGEQGVLVICELMIFGIDVVRFLMWPESFDQPTEPAHVGLALVMGVVALAMFAAMFLGFPIWVFWHWRAGANVQNLGREALEYGPVGHVLWWFVPFANLILPYGAMRELYRASDPDVGNDDWLTAEEHPWMPAWWACFLLGGILANFQLFLPLSTGATMLLRGFSVPMVAAAHLFYMRFVWEISQRQTALSERT